MYEYNDSFKNLDKLKGIDFKYVKMQFYCENINAGIFRKGLKFLYSYVNS